MAARRAACLADQARRVARRRGHDLPLPARKPLEAHRSPRRSRGSGRLARLAGSGPAYRALTGKLSGPLPQDEFERIFSRVPRLTVELVIASSETGVLLALRDFGPCEELWHLPGGTVRFGEPVIEAVRRVAQDELGLTVSVGQLLGCIEYPSHYNNGLDSPVGLAFRAQTSIVDMPERDLRSGCAWFTVLPDKMHDEQKEFLVRHLDIVSRGSASET